MRPTQTFKASTVYNPSGWAKYHEILGVTQARWGNTQENDFVLKNYIY